MNIKEETRKMKLASPILAASSLEKRNHALALIRESLLASKEEIFAANHKDLALAEENGIAPAVKKRLKFDEGKLADVEAELTGLIGLPDPIDRVTLARELDEGLSLYRVTCPIGVIGVIFEARPDALVQISSLCLKSGNCAILKGGKETTYTKAYGRAPDQFAASAYDGVYMAMDAMKRAGTTTDHKKIRDALAQMKDFKGVCGTFSFDEKRDPVVDLILMKMQDGKFGVVDVK